MKDKRKIVFIFAFFLVVALIGVVYISFSPVPIQFLTQATTTVPTTTVPTPTTQKSTATTQTPSGTFQPSVVTLEIKSWGFNPNMVTLLKGSTATWTNLDGATHTVTSAGNFDSGDIAAGKSWTYTFNKAGTFEYSCKYHPDMKAKVVITE